MQGTSVPCHLSVTLFQCSFVSFFVKDRTDEIVRVRNNLVVIYFLWFPAKPNYFLCHALRNTEAFLCQRDDPNHIPDSKQLSYLYLNCTYLHAMRSGVMKGTGRLTLYLQVYTVISSNRTRSKNRTMFFRSLYKVLDY